MARSTLLTLGIALLMDSSPSLAASTEALVRRMNATRGADLSTLILDWKNSNDTNLPKNLLNLALNEDQPERIRAMAFKGVASLQRAGRTKIPDSARTKLERDRSWVMRLALLQWLDETQAPGVDKSLEKALRDPALIIRTEAGRLLARSRRPSTLR